jgi:hypothetical protein
LQFDHFWDLGTFASFNANNCSVLSIDSFNLDTISIYPNPASNKIQLSNIIGISAKIRIFNVLGKQVFYQKNIQKKSIDVSNFTKGIYLVKIYVEGKSKTQKLVIQ